MRPISLFGSIIFTLVTLLAIKFFFKGLDVNNELVKKQNANSIGKNATAKINYQSELKSKPVGANIPSESKLKFVENNATIINIPSTRPSSSTPSSSKPSASPSSSVPTSSAPSSRPSSSTPIIQSCYKLKNTI